MAAPEGTRGGLLRVLVLLQGAYFFVTGVWPLVHVRSFMAVTGPKTDVWLLKTLSLLITAVGVALLHAGLRGKGSQEARTLGIGSAAALMASDVYYAGRGRISKIYLLDAIAEAGLILGWLVFGKRSEVPGGSEVRDQIRRA